MTAVDERAAKRARYAAAAAAVESLTEGATIGLGSGRAVVAVIELAARRWPAGPPLLCVAASSETERRARVAGFTPSSRSTSSTSSGGGADARPAGARARRPAQTTPVRPLHCSTWSSTAPTRSTRGSTCSRAAAAPCCARSSWRAPPPCCLIVVEEDKLAALRWASATHCRSRSCASAGARRDGRCSSWRPGRGYAGRRRARVRERRGSLRRRLRLAAARRRGPAGPRRRAQGAAGRRRARPLLRHDRRGRGGARRWQRRASGAGRLKGYGQFGGQSPSWRPSWPRTRCEVGLGVAIGVLLDTFIVRSAQVSSLVTACGAPIGWPGSALAMRPVCRRIHRRRACPPPSQAPPLARRRDQRRIASRYRSTIEVSCRVD